MLLKYPDGPPYPIVYDREYDLVVRQEPKQARMCGVGGKGSLTVICDEE